MTRRFGPPSAVPAGRKMAWLMLALVTGLAGMALPGRATRADAGDKPLPSDLAMVPGDAVAFFRVDVAALLHDPELKDVWERIRKENVDQLAQAEKELGMPLSEVDRVLGVFFRMSRRPGDEPFVVLVTTRNPTDRKAVLAGMLGTPKAEPAGEYTLYTGKETRAACFVTDRTFVTGTEPAVREFLGVLGKGKTGPLAPALRAAVAPHLVAVGVNTPPLFEQLPADLPEQAKSFEALRKTKLVTVTVDVDKDTRLFARLVFDAETEAKAGEKALKSAHLFMTIGVGGMLGSAKKNFTHDQYDLLRQLNTAFQKLTIKASGNDVELKFTAPIDRARAATALSRGMDSARNAAERTRNQNNLKQLGLALHAYHDSNGRFPPPAVLAKDGTPLLSWRVLVLPYLEEGDLARQFKMDEPWDSDTNKKLLARMPAVFATKSGGPRPPFVTHYQVFTGPETAFPEAGRKLQDITDGTSNTFLIAEAAAGVEWTKPDDLPYAKDKPLPKLGCLEAGRFSVAFADGAVRTFSQKVAEPTLRAFITAAAGDVPGESE